MRRALESFFKELSRKDRLELAFALAEEVDPTEKEKRLVEEFRKEPHKFISQEKKRRSSVYDLLDSLSSVYNQYVITHIGKVRRW